MSRLIRAASAAGIFGGAAMANQVIERKPGKPDSAIVGSSFTASTRSGLATARILILSPRHSGTEVVSVSKNMSTWPPMRSLIAGAEPR